MQTTGENIARYFGGDFELTDEARAKPAAFNVAPTDPLIVVQPGWIRVAHWGVPRPRGGGLSINARDDQLRRNPNWRRLLRGGRVVIPFDGFFEWSGPVGRRQPWLFRRRDGEPLLLAGLLDASSGRDDAVIITTQPSADVVMVHDRMPAVLDRAVADAWLSDGDVELLSPAPDGALIRHAVSQRVNNSRENGPELLDPVQPLAEQQELF